jgi:hypothetical protein
LPLLIFPLVAPRPPGTQLEKFGFIVGEEGTITIQVNANPRPFLTWSVDYENIPEGNMDTTQRFQADSIREMVCIHNFLNIYIYKCGEQFVTCWPYLALLFCLTCKYIAHLPYYDLFDIHTVIVICIQPVVTESLKFLFI